VSCDLTRFEAIVPCGLQGVEMTSVVRERGPVDLAEVEARVAAHLEKTFG